MSAEQRCWWVIRVTGYGRFGFYGTDSEAEEMRTHKAAWEGGIGSKRRADESDPAVLEQIRRVRMEIARGYGRSDEREQAETRAVLALDEQPEARGNGE